MTTGHAIDYSLYDARTGAATAAAPDPRRSPGTGFTHSVETIDNDRAALLLNVGVVR